MNSVVAAPPAAASLVTSPWPHYARDEIDAVAAVLASGKVNYWTGTEVAAFERDYAAHVGTRHAIAMMNGTVALEAALIALGVGPGDEVIVTPRTFVASAEVIVLRGAKPVFADVDAESQNVTAATIAPHITPATRALIVVHLAGQPCDMDPIMALARAHGLRVIEDCAQAHGATYKGRPVGGIGDIGAFSFCQDKILSTGGEGGMVTTDDPDYWAAMWSYKDHGKSYEAVSRRDHGIGYRWVHEGIGSNWRMTEMQAAIGRIQLRKLPEWSATRRRNAQRLRDGLADQPALRIPAVPADMTHAFYKFYAFVRPERLQPGWDRDRVVAEAVALGVPCFTGSCGEVYREKAFADAGLAPPERLPVARRLAETSVMLPVHPTLRDAEIDAVIGALGAVLSAATRG